MLDELRPAGRAEGYCLGGAAGTDGALLRSKPGQPASLNRRADRPACAALFSIFQGCSRKDIETLGGRAKKRFVQNTHANQADMIAVVLAVHKILANDLEFSDETRRKCSAC